MPKYFTDRNGIKHELVGKSTKKITEVQALDREYGSKAAEMASEYDTDIFYCLKQIDGIGNFINAQYFAIPIEPEEVMHIIEEYGESYFIGITYNKNNGHRPPLVTKIRRNTQTESTVSVGIAFEKHCAGILLQNGFEDIKFTPKSGDHGADLIAYKDDVKYVIQCKWSKSNIGFKAVQEVHTARDLYHAEEAVVMTNSTFTQQAKDDAKRLNVRLFENVRD